MKNFYLFKRDKVSFFVRLFFKLFGEKTTNTYSDTKTVTYYINGDYYGETFKRNRRAR